MEERAFGARDLSEELRLLQLSLLGCGLIAIGSWIRIPCYPVPFTLQTLAIFILGLTQTPKQAFASAACYLACASIGLPVLDGKADCLWITGKCAGYLISFPIAAYAIAKLRQKFPSFLALLLGEAIILLFGYVWLVPFIGAEIAWTKGVVLFIPSAVLKGCAAISLVKWRNR